MPGDEENARHLFDQFSWRWTGGGGYDADETLRVWDTLRGSTNPGGYPLILRLARDEGYTLPPDHPWRAENEFEADPNAAVPESGGLLQAGQLIDQIDPRSWDTLADRVDQVLATFADLPPRERTIAKIALGNKLERSLGRPGTQELLRSLAPANEHGAFAPDPSGLPILQQLGPEDLRIENPYLVHKRVPAGAVGALISDFSLGKTWLTIDLGCSVAFGRAWFGCETTQSPVIFLIAEGNRVFPGRLFGWLHANDILPAQSSISELFEALENRVIINKYPTQFDDLDFEPGLISTVKQTGAGLVVIDTLGKTLGDEQPENDNDVANAVTGMLSRLAAETGCTTLFTHHTGYGQARARGGSGWEQGLDFSYLIKGDRSTFEDGGTVCLTLRKMRDGEWYPDIHFRLEKLADLSLQPGPGCEPVDVSSAVVEVVEAPFEPPPLPVLARVFLHIQEDAGCSAQSIRKNVQGSNNRIDAAVKELLKVGAIQDHGSHNRHRYQAVLGWLVGGDGRVGWPGAEFEVDPSLPIDDSATKDPEL